jgi:hypothetical protein
MRASIGLFAAEHGAVLRSTAMRWHMPSGIAAFASPRLELIDGAEENARLLPWIEPCFLFSPASLWAAVIHACPGDVYASAC